MGFIIIYGELFVSTDERERERHTHCPDWDLSMPPSGLRDTSPTNGASQAN